MQSAKLCAVLQRYAIKFLDIILNRTSDYILHYILFSYYSSFVLEVQNIITLSMSTPINKKQNYIKYYSKLNYMQ